MRGISAKAVAGLSIPFALGTMCGQLVVGFKIDQLNTRKRKMVLTTAFVGR